MATVTRERRNDIAKLLTTLVTPCGSSYSEHDWHKCPRCLLIEALSQRGGVVFDLLREGAAALASPPAEGAPCPSCHGSGGDRWHESDGSEHGEKCPRCDGFGRAPAPPASDPPGLVANWRPIETAPKRTDVLAGWADRPHWLPQVLQQDDAGMWFNGEESDYRPPTHWMPLPASPQAKED